MKQNKIAIVNWVLCQSFIVRTRIQEYPSVDDFEGKKRLHGVFTLFKNSMIYCKVIYCS